MTLSAVAFLALGAIGAATTARAGGVYEISVVQAGVVDSTEYPVMPGGHDVVMGVSEWQAPEPDDSENPFRGLHGTCFGMTEFQGDEIIGGGGYCTYKDADGDSYVSRWVPKKITGHRGTTGEWMAFGGTGKWEGVTGSGTYEITRTEGPGARSRKLVGTVTLR